MTHTPGPWSYHKWGISSGTNFGIENADHKHGLAGITPNGNASTMIAMDEHEANAMLMAAAPELLAACMMFTQIGIHHDWSKQFPELWNKMQIALSRAVRCR